MAHALQGYIFEMEMEAQREVGVEALHLQVDKTLAEAFGQSRWLVVG